MSHSIHVMLVEDSPEYREVVQLALQDESDIELISQFGTAEIALRSLSNSKGSKSPDLVLLDLNLPGMSGLEAIPFFKTSLPETKILILTQSDNEADILKAISEGADGYLLKSSSLDEITDSIRSVSAGGASLDPSVAKFILSTLKAKLPQEEIESHLTSRELEILSLLADGLLKKQIADQLAIGYTTVDSHVGNIYEKLNVKNAASAISAAFRQGLL